MDKKDRPNNEQNGEQHPPLPGPVLDGESDRHAEGKDRPAHDQTGTPKKDRRNPQSSNDRRAWKNTTIANRRLIWLTAIVAAANCLYALLAWRQLTAMKDQAKVMSGQLEQMKADSNSTSVAMDKQLKAMKDQGDAMAKQLDQMRETSNLEYRPWVGYRARVMEQIAVGKEIRCDLVFRNTGKTPAFRVRVSSSFFYWPPKANIRERLRTGCNGELLFLPDEPFLPPTEMTIAPNADGTVGATCTLCICDETLTEIRTRRFVLYLVSTVVYEDMWGKTHTTNHCHTVDPDGKDITQYEQYNEMN
jgi:hypothetical protein